MDHNKLWKILKEIRIPDHLTCLLRNLYAGQEATVRTGHGTTDWFQIGKGVRQGCILSPYIFNLYAEYLMKPFKYDLNQILYDYTMKVRNRFMGLDLIDTVPDELWTEVHDIVQETGIKIILMEKKCKK